jgi:formylglycine-generating enzyme required for sulfatase activity
MRSVNPFFITACLSAFLFPPPSGRAAEPAAAPAVPKMETVFDIARPQTQDVIYFRSEDIVQGQLLNDKVGVVTQYGTLSIPLRRCAGLSFEASRANADAVVTVNFNRFTGIVTDHVFRFRIASSGMEVPLRKETIAFVLLKKTAEETDFLKSRDKTDLFVMANGDVLSGQVAEQTVQVRTDYAKVPVPFSEIKEVRMPTGSDMTAVITRTSGETMRGAWETDELSLNLEIELSLPAIYRDKFARIFPGRARELAPGQFGIQPAVPAEPEGMLPVPAVALDEKTIALDLGKKATMKLVLIPAGKFLMGSPADEAGRDEDEGPLREVVISKPFYLGVHEVTQDQYEAVMGAKPSKFVDAAKPVECVSWEDAVEFCRRLARKTNQAVALPTEAQWEYACRAGSKARFSSGDDDRQFYTFARFGQGPDAGTAPVGSKKPNAWGLFDMHGNVWEWCSDWYAGSYVNAAPRDPTGPISGQGRVLRGGSWVNTIEGCRCATRNKSAPDARFNAIGFRIVVNPK